MRLRPRRLRTLACLTGLVALAAAPAVARADDPPANDVRAQAVTIPLVFNRGVQVLGPSTERVDLANSDEDPTDPDVHSIDSTTLNAGSTCLPWAASADEPFRGHHTIWYALAWPNGRGGSQLQPSERTFVELTSFQMRYAHAIAVLRNGVLVHCEAQNVRVPAPVSTPAYYRSSVSFVAQPEDDDRPTAPTYEVVVVAGGQVPSDESAQLVVRAVDMSAPRFSVVARPSEAQPGKSTSFDMRDVFDAGSGIDPDSVTWKARWADGGDIGEPSPPLSLTPKIIWPKAASQYPRPSKGRVALVTATISDKEGNRSRVTLTFTVKDRSRPIARLSAVGTGPSTLRLSGRCTEAAKLTFRVTKSGSSKLRPMQPRRVWNVRARRPVSASVDLPSRGLWNLKATCTDRAGNQDDAAISFVF